MAKKKNVASPKTLEAKANTETARAKAHCFGSHMSIAGGLEKAIEKGHIAGCDCVQIFTKNRTSLHFVLA